MSNKQDLGFKIMKIAIETYLDNFGGKRMKNKEIIRNKIHSMIWNFLGEIDCQDLINADKGEGEQIDTKFTKYFDTLINTILTLIPEEGKVIAEGKVEFFGTIGERWGVYKIGGQFINEILEKVKTKGKKGRLIFILDKE